MKRFNQVRHAAFPASGRLRSAGLRAREMAFFVSLAAAIAIGWIADGRGEKLAQAETESAKPIENTVGMKFVKIEPGTFVMGSPDAEEGHDKDETQHKVTITKAFMMATTPVTQAQWKAVMGTAPSHFKGNDLPVEQVSWNDAVEFCRKLCAKEGKKYRLPTEAEGEYSCRAGTTGRYAGTRTLDDMGWYADNSGDSPLDSAQIFATDQAQYGDRLLANHCQTHPVGQKKANAWGVYDMHGNVYQWCQDFYGDYAAGGVTDPIGDKRDKTSSRVLRGGSCYGIPRVCRSAFRNRFAPISRFNDVGFRVCLDFE